MLNIRIKTINHKEQRYDTCGDWVWEKNKAGHRILTIYVSDMCDWKKEFLVAFHELIEVTLCKERHIPQEIVDNFDLEYEARRAEDDLTSEPGDSEQAPYHKEHVFATELEKKMAKELGMDWENYEKTIYSL